MENDFLESHFKTFAEAKFAVEKFCRENFHPVTIAQKTTFASFNKIRLNNKSQCFDFPENECCNQKWICKHARQPRKRNKEGKRNSTSYFTNCKMKLPLVYNKHIKGYHFINVCLEHNHEHGSEVYNKYPDQRIPKGELKCQVKKLLKLGTKPSAVLDHLHSHGLKTTRQDIQNLKQMCKRQDSDTSLDEVVQLFDGKNVLKTFNSNEKKENVTKKMTATETSNKSHRKSRKRIKKNIISFNKLPQKDSVEGYINDRGEFENEDGCQDWEKVRGIDTWIGNKRMKENKIDTEVMSVINIKRRKTTSSEDCTNNHKQNNESIINNLFENRKKLFYMERLKTETHKEYKTRFEELYEMSRIEEMSKEQLKCFHFTKTYKESEEEDYLRKMTEKMSLNKKTTLEELVQICEEVDQLKTHLMMFNDMLELPSDLTYSEHNHSGPSQQLPECDCFTCGLKVHWRKDCPINKNINSNLEISKSRLLKSLKEKRETVGCNRSVIEERITTDVNRIKDNSYFGYDSTNVRFDQENITKLNANIRFDKKDVCDKTKICLKKISPPYVDVTYKPSTTPNNMPSTTPNNMPSTTPNNMPNSISNNMSNSTTNNMPSSTFNNMPNSVSYSSIPSSSFKSSISSPSGAVSPFNSYHLASSTPVNPINIKCLVSSNPHVIKIAQLNPSSKPKSICGLPVSLSLANVKANNIIKSSICKRHECFKNIVLIGSKSVGSSGVTPVDTLNNSTFKSFTFGTVKINNTKNIEES